jgi:hypothetical protein
MGPSLLEPKLGAKVYKTERFLSQREFLHADKVVVVFYLIFDFLLRFIDPVDEWGRVVNDLKFPVGRKIVGRFEYPFFKPGVVGVKKILPEIVSEISPQALDIFIYLLKHKGIDFPPLFTHQLVKNRGLDVGEDHPWKEFENPPLDQFQPVDLGLPLGFFQLSELAASTPGTVLNRQTSFPSANPNAPTQPEIAFSLPAGPIKIRSS